MVEIRGLGLQDAGFAGGVNVVDVVGEAVNDNRTLDIVEGRLTCCNALADDWIANSAPSEAVVIGALDMNQAAVARVVVGNEDARAIRGDPLTVRLRRIDDLGGAVLRVEVGDGVRTSNCRNTELCRMEGRVAQKNERLGMQRSRGSHIHVSVAATEDDLAGLLERRVDHSLERGCQTERSRPQVRARAQRDDAHRAVGGDGDLRFTIAVRTQQGSVAKLQAPAKGAGERRQSGQKRDTKDSTEPPESSRVIHDFFLLLFV